jgi:hypothetical protein
MKFFHYLKFKIKIKTKIYGRVSTLVCRIKDCGKPTELGEIKIS